MNQQTIIGNLTRDPDTGATQSGVNWCRFTVAVRKEYRKEDGPDADFIRVTAWRGLGDICAKYLKRGSKVAVVGTPAISTWIGKDGTAKGQLELTARDVEFCGRSEGRADEPTDADAPPGPRYAEQTDPESGMTVVDEEQPF